MSPPRVLRCPPSPLQTVSTAKRGLCCRTSNAFDSRDLSARVRLTHRRIPMGHTWLDQPFRSYRGKRTATGDWTMWSALSLKKTRPNRRAIKSKRSKTLYDAGRYAIPEPRLSPSNDFGKYLGKKALVIGAGPGGLVSALYLAREGFTVEVRLRTRVFGTRCRRTVRIRCLRSEVIHGRIPIR